MHVGRMNLWQFDEIFLNIEFQIIFFKCTNIFN
jgi:hypothetical protein